MALGEIMVDGKIFEDISNSRFQNWNLGELAVELIRLDQMRYFSASEKIKESRRNSSIYIYNSRSMLIREEIAPVFGFYDYSGGDMILMPYCLMIKNDQVLFFEKILNNNGSIAVDGKPRTPTHYEIQDMRARIIYEISKYHEKIKPTGNKDFTMYVDLSKTVLTTDNVTSITTASNSFQSMISATFFDT